MSDFIFKKFKESSTVLGVCLAFGFSILGLSIYKSVHFSKMSDRVITVKGLVEEVVKSDYGVLTMQVTIPGNDLSGIYKEFSQANEKVITFLQERGFVKNEITTVSNDLRDNYTGTSEKEKPINRYVLKAHIILKTEKVDSIEQLMQSLGSLIQLGVPISSTHVAYQYKKFSQIRAPMLQKATQNAREVAAQFASDAGTTIGSIRRANQGAFSILRSDSSPTDEYSGGEEQSLMKKIRVVSTIEFFLD